MLKKIICLMIGHRFRNTKEEVKTIEKGQTKITTVPIIRCTRCKKVGGIFKMKGKK